MKATPQIDTFLKILAPLGYTPFRLLDLKKKILEKITIKKSQECSDLSMNG